MNNLDPIIEISQWDVLLGEDRKTIFLSRFSHCGYRYWERLDFDQLRKDRNYMVIKKLLRTKGIKLRG